MLIKLRVFIQIKVGSFLYNKPMTKELYELVMNLKTALDEDEDILKLNVVEEVMKADHEVQELSFQFEQVQHKLNELLEYLDVEHESVKKTRGELSIIKYSLDIHPLVVAYNNQYKIVNKIYGKINKRLFKDFCNEKGCKCL